MAKNSNQAFNNMQEKARNYLKQQRIQTILWSVVLIAVGIFLLIRPAIAVRLVCQGIGALLVVYGVVTLQRNSRNVGSVFDLTAVGILAIIFGAMFIFSPYILTGFFKFVFAVLIFGSALSELAELEALRAYHDSRWYFCLISGIISIIFAIIILFYPVENVVIRIAGIALIYAGISKLVFHFRAARFVNSAAEQAGEVFRNMRDAADGRAHYDAYGNEIIEGTATIEDSEDDI